MLIQKREQERGKGLDFYILYYAFHNINIPFDCKTLAFALRGLDYKKNYLAMTLSRLKKCRFLTEEAHGIYCMTQESFKMLDTLDPVLAKELKCRLKFEKSVECQNFS